MAHENSLANLKRGGSPGRPKGLPNKATREVKEFCRGLVTDPRYRAELERRLIAGELSPAVEVMVWYYAFGRPTHIVSLEGLADVDVVHVYGNAPQVGVDGSD